MKKRIFMIIMATTLLCGSIFIGCGKNETNSSSVSVNNDISELDDAVDELHIGESQKEITDFYEALYKAYTMTQPGEGYKPSEILSYLKEPIDKFVNIDFQENEYSDYVKEIQSNPFLSKLINDYINNKDVDFDYYMFASTYNGLIEDILEELLKVEVPFEYESEFQDNENESDENALSHQEINGILGDYVAEMCKHGVPIQEYDYGLFYAYPEETQSMYKIGSSQVGYSVAENFGDKKSYNFQINLDLYDYNKTPSSVTFKAGDSELTFYSNQLTYIGLYTYDYFCVVAYDSTYTANANSNYEALKEMFNENDSIDVSIGDELNFTITQEDIENTRVWFQFFDILRNYLE